MFKQFDFQFFHVTPSNFPRLAVKTASPGPVVSVPTPGSCVSHDFIWKIPKNPPVKKGSLLIKFFLKGTNRLVVVAETETNQTLL